MPNSNAPWKVGGALALAALVAGGGWVLTRGDDTTRGGDGAPSDTPTAQAGVEVTVGRVAGRLDDTTSTTLAADVTATLQEYVDNAFLGDYPRTDYSTAFSAFTEGAAATAEEDRELVTAATYADSTSVVADELKAKLAVYSPNGKPAGATAKVRFSFDVDDQPVVYAGRLLLTKDKGAWRIFGYDLKRNDAPTGAAQ